jgi:hypothetical protein
LCATGEISTSGNKNPSDAHVRTAKRLIGYIKGTPNAVLRLGGTDAPILFAFCDASYRPEGQSKSRLGGAMFLGLDSGAFHCFSKNGSLVATSSTHAELQALDEVVRLVVHTHTVLDFLRYPQSATTIYLDSTSSIDLCSMLRVTHRTASINMRIHYIRQLLNLSIIRLVFVPTALNVADLLTKPLAYIRHNMHSSRLMTGFGGQEITSYIDSAVATITIVTSLDLEQFSD